MSTEPEGELVADSKKAEGSCAGALVLVMINWWLILELHVEVLIKELSAAVAVEAAEDELLAVKLSLVLVLL